jgi:multisubunit Na+/H+ antiporter MnhB subunit
MEAYQWIHPAVAVTTLLLLAATAWTKLRSKKYFRVHYSLATAAVAGVIATFGLAVYTVVRCDCPDDWPLSLFVHFPLALLLTGFVLGQATMGVSMLLFGRKPRLFRAHRFNAKIVLGLAAMVLLLGVITVALLLVR